jgi:hypothetical protein
MYMPKEKGNKPVHSKEDKTMMNIFEETYEAMEAGKEGIRGRPQPTRGKDAAEKAYGEAKDRMAAKGDIACKNLEGLREIKRQRERDPRLQRHHLGPGCRSPDHLHERRTASRPSPTPARQPTPLKPYGFSSRPAASIGEMVEINLRKDLWGKTYEKGHAFKMSIA